LEDVVFLHVLGLKKINIGVAKIGKEYLVGLKIAYTELLYMKFIEDKKEANDF
jgi:hypothetical protein